MKSEHPLRVHLYQVLADKALQPLDVILSTLSELPLERRVRGVDGQEYRMDIAKAPEGHWPVWRFAVCKFRHEGPGLATRSTPSQSMPLADGQEWTEDTAGLYVPDKKVVVLQYNHFGPRAGHIAEYFSESAGVADSSYYFQPSLNPDAQARLGTKVQFTRVAFRVAPAKLSHHWKQNNVAFSSALHKQVEDWGSEWVLMDLSLDARTRGHGLNLADKLKALVGLSAERDAVKKLEIRGRDHDRLSIDPIDLLAERLQQSFRGLPLDAGRRIALDDRWRSLMTAYTIWTNDGHI